MGGERKNLQREEAMEACASGQCLVRQRFEPSICRLVAWGKKGKAAYDRYSECCGPTSGVIRNDDAMVCGDCVDDIRLATPAGFLYEIIFGEPPRQVSPERF